VWESRSPPKNLHNPEPLYGSGFFLRFREAARLQARFDFSVDLSTFVFPFLKPQTLWCGIEIGNMSKTIKVLDKDRPDSIVTLFDEAARKVAKTLIFEN
jgi:hypothetical protein